MKDIVVILFVVSGYIIGVICTSPIYFEQGQISVASGQTKCELKTNVDKTTKWECTKAK